MKVRMERMMPQTQLHVCFFARVDDAQKLRHVGFYAQDIEALEASGHRVTIATSWREIPWNADVYFVWWWTYAFLPLVKAKLRRRPVIITGTFNLRWGTGDYFHRPLLQRIALRIALRLASLNIFVSKHENDQRSDVRRLGKEGVRPCRYGVSTYH